MSILLIKSSSHSLVWFSRPSDLATLYYFPHVNSTLEDHLQVLLHTFVCAVLSADQMSCRASAFLKLSLTGLVHGDLLPLFLSSELGSASFYPGLVRNLPWFARGFTYLFLPFK